MLNVAIIGIGDWGRNLVRTFYQIEKANLTSLFHSYGKVSASKNSDVGNSAAISCKDLSFDCWVLH